MIPSIDMPQRAVYDEIVAEVHRIGTITHKTAVHQFSIDFFEEYLPELVCEPSGWSCSGASFSDCIDSLRYKVSNICEVLDPNNEDFKLFSQFYNRLKEWDTCVYALDNLAVKAGN